MAGLGSVVQLQPLLQGCIDFGLRRVLRESFGLGADIESLEVLGGVPRLGTFGPRIGGAISQATVQPEGKVMEEATVAQQAAVWSLTRAVHAAVQLQVDVLRELGATHFTLVGLLPRVQAQVRLQVAGAAETLLAHLWDGQHKTCLLFNPHLLRKPDCKAKGARQQGLSSKAL